MSSKVPPLNTSALSLYSHAIYLEGHESSESGKTLSKGHEDKFFQTVPEITVCLSPTTDSTSPRKMNISDKDIRDKIYEPNKSSHKSPRHLWERKSSVTFQNDSSKQSNFTSTNVHTNESSSLIQSNLTSPKVNSNDTSSEGYNEHRSSSSSRGEKHSPRNVEIVSDDKKERRENFQAKMRRSCEGVLHIQRKTSASGESSDSRPLQTTPPSKKSHSSDESRRPSKIFTSSGEPRKPSVDGERSARKFNSSDESMHSRSHSHSLMASSDETTLIEGDKSRSQGKLKHLKDVQNKSPAQRFKEAIRIFGDEAKQYDHDFISAWKKHTFSVLMYCNLEQVKECAENLIRKKIDPIQEHRFTNAKNLLGEVCYVENLSNDDVLHFLQKELVHSCSIGKRLQVANDFIFTYTIENGKKTFFTEMLYRAYRDLSNNLAFDNILGRFLEDQSKIDAGSYVTSFDFEEFATLRHEMNRKELKKRKEGHLQKLITKTNENIRDAVNEVYSSAQIKDQIFGYLNLLITPLNKPLEKSAIISKRIDEIRSNCTKLRQGLCFEHIWQEPLALYINNIPQNLPDPGNEIRVDLIFDFYTRYALDFPIFIGNNKIEFKDKNIFWHVVFSKLYEVYGFESKKLLEQISNFILCGEQDQTTKESKEKYKEYYDKLSLEMLKCLQLLSNVPQEPIDLISLHDVFDFYERHVLEIKIPILVNDEKIFCHKENLWPIIFTKLYQAYGFQVTDEILMEQISIFTLCEEFRGNKALYECHYSQLSPEMLKCIRLLKLGTTNIWTKGSNYWKQRFGGLVCNDFDRHCSGTVSLNFNIDRTMHKNSSVEVFKNIKLRDIKNTGHAYVTIPVSWKASFIPNSEDQYWEFILRMLKYEVYDDVERDVVEKIEKFLGNFHTDEDIGNVFSGIKIEARLNETYAERAQGLQFVSRKC